MSEELSPMLRSDAEPAFLPEGYGQLIIRPVLASSVAAQVCTVVPTSSETFRVPIVAEDAAAGWYAEGAEIAVTEADLDEAAVKPKKLAGLSVISNELAADTSPAAANLIGDGLGRDIARKLDAAYFGDTTANADNGIEDITANEVDAGGEWSDMDPFNEAIYDAEGKGATLTAFVANATDALALAQLKESTGSNRDLLQSDPTKPTRRMLCGVPLYVSPAVTVGTIWGIPRDRCLLVVRQDVTLDVDRSRYFEFDSVGVRAVMRCTWAFPHETAVQKISETGGIS